MPHGKLLDGIRVSIREMSSDNDNDNDDDDADNDIRGPSECIEPHLACCKSHRESPTKCGEVVPICYTILNVCRNYSTLRPIKNEAFTPSACAVDTRVCPSATFAFNVPT